MAGGDITHPFVSAIADSGDATLVEPSDWNATHAIAAFADGLAYYCFPYGVAIEPTGGVQALASSNLVRCTRFYLPFRLTVAQLVWRNPTPSGTVGMAIYSADGTTRELTSGGVAAAAVNSVAITPVTLEPGFHWLAWTANNTTNTFQVFLGGGVLTQVNDTVVQSGTAANASSAGAPPTALGVVTSANVGVLSCKLQS